MGSISLESSTKALINLQLGRPSPRLFAARGLLAGANEVLQSQAETESALAYGPHIGHPPLRQSVAEWLSSVYSRSVTSDRICISNGASANLSNILLKYTDPLYTRKIFMIEPTYFLACPIFEDNGFQGKLRGIPETHDDGLNTDFLRRELEAAEQDAVKATKANGTPDTPILKTGKSYSKIFKYVIYIVPTFSNPSGKTLSLGMRKSLVSLAREFDALVISDDVYDFLSWPEDPAASVDAVASIPPRLVDIDRDMPGYSTFGNTLSNGSFSKVIGPGARVGWSECTPAFAKELGEVSGGAPSHLASTFVDKMLRSGQLQSHIKDTLIPTYRSRFYVLMTSITTLLLPLGVTVESSTLTPSTATAGGFFTYLRLPSDLPSAKVTAAYALKHKQLRIAFGHMFTVYGDDSSVVRAEGEGGFAGCVRLCWAWHEGDEIRMDIERLRATIVEIRVIVERGESVGVGVEEIGIR